MHKILVVDDEYWIRKGIASMVDCINARISGVFEAESVQKAKEIYDREKPDIVLADVCFPSDNGCDLGEYIYKDNPRVCIIMISAHADFNFAQRALQFHARNYLVKPVSKEKLNSTIMECVHYLENSHELKKGKKPSDNQQTQDNFSAEVVQDIISRLDEDCSQQMSLGELARYYHISEPYLSTVFKKLTGKSLTNYIMEIRIEKACQLIAMNKSGTDKLYAIAQEVGYDNYQYFVRVFRKTMGVSPSEFQIKTLSDGD